MKILVTRTDKLGDLVLSIPVFEYLKLADPSLEVHALVAPSAVPLVENNPHLSGLWTWDENGSAEAEDELCQRLKAERFNAAIMLQYRRELALLLGRAGIGKRYGPWSRFSSWFLLNRGSRQARAHSRLHEMDQNLNLARRFLGSRSKGIEAPSADLFLTNGQLELGQDFRRQYFIGDDQVVFIHPGSGGSALDWSSRRFCAVANTLAALDGFRVFITGSAADTARVNEVIVGLADEVEVLLNRYNLRDFLGILSAGDYFVGPSTGPLHLAATLGLGTVGLYPPVLTMSPQRWGPRGKLTTTVVPGIECPARRVCSLERCEHFNCMDEVYEREVLGAVMELHRQKNQAAFSTDAVQEEES